MGYPQQCDICLKEQALVKLGEKNFKLIVRPFKQAKDPKVMLVGLNPTLIKKKAEIVLELDDKKSSIYRFIKDDVLAPAGIMLDEHVYATNLVKCTFSKEPRIMSQEASGQKGNEAVKKLLSPFFKNCRRYFEEEIKEIQPRLLIGLGEVPHQLIAEEFGLAQQGVEIRMKNAFGNIYPTKMLDLDIKYVPCIRPKVKNHACFKEQWKVFFERLQESVI